MGMFSRISGRIFGTKKKARPQSASGMVPWFDALNADKQKAHNESRKFTVQDVEKVLDRYGVTGTEREVYLKNWPDL